MNRRPIVLAAALTLATVAGAGAASAQQRGQQCFRTGDVTAWRAVGTRAVNLQVNYRDIYRLRFTYPCDALNFAGERIGFNKTGLGPVCTGLDVDVVVRGMTCPVASIRKLSRAEMASMPKNQRP